MFFYLDGEIQTVSVIGENSKIETGDNRNLMMGTNDAANHFSGILDEVRLYDLGLVLMR